MKILIVCEYDNGGQMVTLRRAINEFTEHQARLITFKETYLNYDTDIVDPTLNQVNTLLENIDFIILGEMLSIRMQTQPIFKKIRPNNTIIRAGGTLARYNPERYINGPLRNIMKTGAYHDITITKNIHPMACTENMYYFTDWPILNQKTSTIKLVFSGTAQKQNQIHSGAIKEAWNILKKHNFTKEVEFVNIVGKSWNETLEIKSKCHICYDQMSIGAYANSAIEGMYYEMPTFCRVSKWCKMIYPNLPLINVTSTKDIVDESIKLIENKEYRYTYSLKSKVFALRNHSVNNAIKKWNSLINFVSGI